MRLERILVPTDFSASSEQALDFAMALARDTGATLLLLHVAEPLPLYSDMPYSVVQEPDLPELRQRLHSISVAAQIPTERHVVVGAAADEILELAKQERADLIVMGTHGRTGLSRVLMGSVAEVVMRRAPCPVLTVKATAAVPADI